MIDLKYLVTKIFIQKKRMNASRRIAAGFVVIILAGALLLMLPISSKHREVTPFLTSLFTATSATCVTGLVLVDTAVHWSLFGQVVLLCLIQIGGLGFISILSIVFLMSNRHIGLRDRMLMAQSLNLDSMSGIVRMMKKIIIIAFSIEAAGAVILSICFVPIVGPVRGIWYGVFHAVSAFCNAGFDLMGTFVPMSSMELVNKNPIILLTISSLIVIGGLGFFVWEEIRSQHCWRKFRLYTKMVLFITPVLIISGWFLFYFFEKNNLHTMGVMSTSDKVLNSLFQSVTTRTAGFASINQAALTDQSKLIATILMMIGGSSGSTAGGIKTVTIGLVIVSAWYILQAKKKVVIRGRHIGHSQIMYAAALAFMALLLVLTGAFAISVLEHVSIIDAMYEVASAYGTVGLSVGVTSPDNSIFTHLILIIYMFFGRVGIMTITVSMLTRSRNMKDDLLNYPSEKLLIG